MSYSAAHASPSLPTPVSDPAIDPLVNLFARSIRHALDDFSRLLDNTDNNLAHVDGSIELQLHANRKSQLYHIAVQPSPDNEQGLGTLKTTLTRAAHSKPLTAVFTPAFTPAPKVMPLPQLPAPASAPPAEALASFDKDNGDDDQEDDDDDSVSAAIRAKLLATAPEKRKLDDSDIDKANKRARSTNGHGDVPSLVTKADIERLLSKLKQEVPQDKSDTVNHVQRLLTRFSSEETTPNHEQALGRPGRPPFRDSVLDNTGSTPTAIPSPSLERAQGDASLPDLIRREARLLSSQIQWVEDCRRVAADVHDKREENWRTSSAGFHDRTRQDRENFQNRILHETTMQSKTLHQILNEVKAIGLYTQSMKWETPLNFSVHPNYTSPTVATPAFPTHQPHLPAATTEASAAKAPIAASAAKRSSASAKR